MPETVSEPMSFVQANRIELRMLTRSMAIRRAAVLFISPVKAMERIIAQDRAPDVHGDKYKDVLDQLTRDELTSPLTRREVDEEWYRSRNALRRIGMGAQFPPPPPPEVQLRNRTWVVNFSSLHTIEFEDGTILEACAPERRDRLKLKCSETTAPDFDNPWTKRVRLTHSVTQDVIDELFRLALIDHLGIVLCPRLVIDAVRAPEDPWFPLSAPQEGTKLWVHRYLLLRKARSGLRVAHDPVSGPMSISRFAD